LEIKKIEEELKGSRTSVKRTNSTKTSTKSTIKSETSNNHSLKNLSKTPPTGSKSSIGNVPKLPKLEDIKKNSEKKLENSRSEEEKFKKEKKTTIKKKFSKIGRSLASTAKSVAYEVRKRRVRRLRRGIVERTRSRIVG